MPQRGNGQVTGILAFFTGGAVEEAFLHRVKQRMPAQIKYVRKRAAFALHLAEALVRRIALYAHMQPIRLRAGFRDHFDVAEALIVVGFVLAGLPVRDDAVLVQAVGAGLKTHVPAFVQFLTQPHGYLLPSAAARRETPYARDLPACIVNAAGAEILYQHRP